MKRFLSLRGVRFSLTTGKESQHITAFLKSSEENDLSMFICNFFKYLAQTLFNFASNDKFVVCSLQFITETA